MFHRADLRWRLIELDPQPGNPKTAEHGSQRHTQLPERIVEPGVWVDYRL